MMEILKINKLLLQKHYWESVLKDCEIKEFENLKKFKG